MKLVAFIKRARASSVSTKSLKFVRFSLHSKALVWKK